MIPLQTTYMHIYYYILYIFLYTYIIIIYLYLYYMYAYYVPLGKKKVKVSKMTRLTPELVTELFCPTLISCENPNVNGAVEKFLEQNV